MREDGLNKSRKKENEERSKSIYDNSYYYAPEKLQLEITKKRKRKFKLTLLVPLCAILLAGLIVFLSVVYNTFFILTKVELATDLNYTSQQVKEASGLSDGQKLYSFDKSEVKNNIKQALPYVTDVKILRIWPNKVKITLSSSESALYTQYGEFFYVLTKDLHVLSKTTDIDSIEGLGLIRFITENVKECIIGKELNIDDKDIPNIYFDLYSALENANILTECTCIDISDKFNVKFEYKGQYTVILGKMYDLEQKIEFMQSIADKLSENDSGIIDVSDDDIQEGIFSPYN